MPPMEVAEREELTGEFWNVLLGVETITFKQRREIRIVNRKIQPELGLFLPYIILTKEIRVWLLSA